MKQLNKEQLTIWLSWLKAQGVSPAQLFHAQCALDLEEARKETNKECDTNMSWDTNCESEVDATLLDNNRDFIMTEYDAIREQAIILGLTK